MFLASCCVITWGSACGFCEDSGKSWESTYQIFLVIMPRPSVAAFRSGHGGYSQLSAEICRHMLVPLAICLCVAISVAFAFYRDQRLPLGPSSSVLFKVNPVFVKQVEVRIDGGKTATLYGFSHKPDLSLQEDWGFSDYMIIGSNSRKEFSLWLNNGSRIRIGWEAEISSSNKLEISVIKGERKYEELPPSNSSSREAEYAIEEDDSYSASITNLSPANIIVLFKLNVSSRVHDCSKAMSNCSTKSGSCRLNIVLPNPQYVAVTTPKNGDPGNWFIEISYITRLPAYIVVLGIVTIFLLIKYLVSNNDPTRGVEAVTSERGSETELLVPDRIFGLPYGTDEDRENTTGSSSEVLYDECTICYDSPQNCYFVPCGHSTCHNCAVRLKKCPTCRTVVKKLVMASESAATSPPLQPQEAAASTPLQPQEAATSTHLQPQETETGTPLQPQDTETGIPLQPQEAAAGAPLQHQEAATGAPLQPQETATNTPLQPQGAATGAPLQPQGAATSTPLQPQETATSIPLQPQEAATSSPLQPQEAATSTPLQPQEAATGVPLQPQETATGTPLQPQETATGTPLQPQET